MPFKSKRIGLVLDRGSHRAPGCRVMPKPSEVIPVREAIGLVVVKLKSFQPRQGKFHLRDHLCEVRKHHDEVAKVLNQNSNEIELFMGDLLVYEFGTYAMCMYVAYEIGKGSRLRWEPIECHGMFTVPLHIKMALTEAQQIYERAARFPEEVIVPDWVLTPPRPTARRPKRRRARK